MTEILTVKIYVNILQFVSSNSSAISDNVFNFNGTAGAIVPTSIDWRKRGAVTDVKNQGRCGSCWSFSSTGALEAHHFLKTNKLVSLSEQNLIDCSRSYGSKGCNGGWMQQAFAYVQRNGGIDTEESYPYRGVNGFCRYNSRNSGATVRGSVSIPEGNEDKLKEAIGTVGPGWYKNIYGFFFTSSTLLYSFIH